METLALVVTLFVGAGLYLTASIFRRFNKCRRMVEAMGVPIDSTSHFIAHKIDFKAHDVACLKKFGTIWGRYNACRPEIFIADPELIKKLLVKKFDNFTDRQHFDFIPERSAFDCVADVALACLPGLAFFIDIYDSKKWDYLWETTKQIVEKREAEEKGGCGDFIDRLVEIKHSNLLNETQTYAQGIGFFQAGFETTSNTMSTLTHALSRNPMVQQRLFEEVEDVLKQFDDKIDHETMSQLHYAHAVIYENLRLNPPLIRIDRQCLKDSKVGHLSIPKDSVVTVPIWAIHHDPNLYVEPFAFNPERFLDADGKFTPQNDASFLAFGGGPRTCIGIRFAMAEMLIALAKFVSMFKIIEVEGAEVVGNRGDPFFYSYPEVRVKLEKR